VDSANIRYAGQHFQMVAHGVLRVVEAVNFVLDNGHLLWDALHALNRERC